MKGDRKIVLMGDSVFDNGAYVPSGASVLDVLSPLMTGGDRVTLLASDGAMTNDVLRQVAFLTGDETHIVVSAGGNDALGMSWILGAPASDVADALGTLGTVVRLFRSSYQDMICVLQGTGLPVAVCTIYNAVPGLSDAEKMALSIFNDVITEEAARNGLPVVDLRVIMTEEADFSPSSPIEPSAQGGEKIARAIVANMTRSQKYSGGESMPQNISMRRAAIEAVTRSIVDAGETPADFSGESAIRELGDMTLIAAGSRASEWFVYANSDEREKFRAEWESAIR